MGLPFDRPVVIYSAGETHNIDATFLAWLLAGFGHRQVYVLDGGYLQVAAGAASGGASSILDWRRRAFPGGAVPAGAGLAGGRPAGAAAPATRSWWMPGPPTSTPARPAPRCGGGTFPGAINHYWQDDLTREGFGYVWKEPAELRAAYEAQGITPDKDIIAYCNSATEASHVHFTLRYLLGYPRVRVYVGSWTEWAEREELPVEVGHRRRSGAPERAKGTMRAWPLRSLGDVSIAAHRIAIPTAAAPAATPSRRP